MSLVLDTGMPSDDVLSSLIPSYKEVAMKIPLKVYESSTLKGKEKVLGKLSLSSPVLIIKGATFGGLQKDFSPVKTRSSSKKVTDGGSIKSLGLNSENRLLRDTDLSRVDR
jgi:hypothetical protein